MPLIAAEHIVGIIDEEAQNEVVNAHLDKVKIETCTWIEQENCLSYFWLFWAHSVKYIDGNSVYRRLAAGHIRGLESSAILGALYPNLLALL